MSSIRVEVDEALLSRLRQLSDIDIAAAMVSVGEALRTSTVERFSREKDPEGRPWKSSIRARQNGGKTLTVQRRLSSSIHVDSSEKGVAVGTDLDYAAVHQFGATIRAKGNGLLRFKIGGQWIAKKEVKIPARPYMGVTEDDKREINRIIQDAVTGG